MTVAWNPYEGETAELRDPGEGFPPLERHVDPPLEDVPPEAWSAPPVETEVVKSKPSMFFKPKPVAFAGVEEFVYNIFEFLGDIGVNIVASGQRLIAVVAGLAAAWFAPKEWSNTVETVIARVRGR